MASTSVSSEDLYSIPQSSIGSSSASLPLQVQDLTSTCNCLEQHFELLCHLRNLEKKRSALSVDAILLSVQQALTTWRSLIDCRVCPHDDDHAVSLLSIMSMRSILRRLQSLCSSNRDRSSSSSNPSTPVQQTAAFKKVTLGTYEATQIEQDLVTDLLINQAFGKLRFALLSLKQKIEHSRGQQAKFAARIKIYDEEYRSSSAGPAKEVGLVRQLLQRLEETVQIIESATRTGHYNASNGHGDGNSR